MRSSRFLVVIFVSLAMLVASLSSVGQTVKDVRSFSDASAARPELVLLSEGRDGKLYGTASGLFLTFGSVYRFQTSGSGGSMYVFDSTSGSQPFGGVTLSTDSNFYGTTSSGGSLGLGVLFKITTAGVFSVLHDFSGSGDGAYPAAPPIEASDGNLYGTTSGQGGANGTVYKYSPQAGYSSIYQFTDASAGSSIESSLTEAADGSLYGTALGGGANNCGTIFKMSKSGTLLVTYSFPCGNGGSEPVASLIQASDGNFYGTTSQGGSKGFGTIFRLDQNFKVTKLHDFQGQPLDGRDPSAGLTEGTDGYLYGASGAGGASDMGALFRMTKDGSFSLLYSFANRVGQSPDGTLRQHTNGLFYGTTALGGTQNLGTIYSLDMGLPPFVAFVRPTGGAGQQIEIIGQGLKLTTSVTFNGISASSFNVFTDTYMLAVVPAGATTGKIVVTTPSGPLTSNVNFRILN